ncbi:MAG TPA: riboflavin biosynthesis protein RibF [Clostridiales bacterium]|nr:riboflavin biosynthesis protein RibF [Clostridiales bacterium]
MKITSVFEKLNNEPILVLGKFDGLHRGHKTLLETAKSLSKESGKPVYVFTFKGGLSQKLLTDEEFVSVAQSLGADGIIYAPLNKEFFAVTKDEFLKLLTDNFSPSAVVAGEDYTFGFLRKGTAEVLKEYFEKNGVNCVIAPLLTENGVKISSTEIRELIKNGDVKKANSLLGYDYFYSGTVTKGRGDGRLFGFPTANVLPDETKLMPKHGVYVTKIKIDDKLYKSLTNVGNAPTFGSSVFTTETFIPDFSGNIYDEKVKIFFKDFVRDVKKFNSKDELYKQIKKDLTKI